MTIYFDMDGTLANFYGVDGWLDCLNNEDTTPYKIATPLVRMNILARVLNNLQKRGFEIGIISWTAKNSSENYHKAVAREKRKWLHTHLKSVNFNEINILEYGVSKSTVATENDILFDDDKRVRNEWCGFAFDETKILEILKAL